MKGSSSPNSCNMENANCGMKRPCRLTSKDFLMEKLKIAYVKVERATYLSFPRLLNILFAYVTSQRLTF